MGKNKGKNSDGTPNPTGIANRDILQRLNFLYQASALLGNLPRPAPRDASSSSPAAPRNDDGSSTGANEGLRPRKKCRRLVSVEELSRSYVHTMKSVGQKTNVRTDPSVKRRICKRCCAPLLPGVSATVRIQESASHGHVISYRCHCCQAERRIPAPPVLQADVLSDDTLMDVRSTEDTTSCAPVVSTNAVKRARKKGAQPRLPPHFARDVGHVVFRGNERLDVVHRYSNPTLGDVA